MMARFPGHSLAGWWWLAALGLLLAALVQPAAAQSSTPPPGGITDDQVNLVAKKLFCPVCENVPLDVCPTQACKQWRDTIKEKIAVGWTDQQILDYFAQQYGERVLAEPSTRGLNVLVWVIPPVLVLAGGVFLWRMLRRMAAIRPPTAAAPLPGADPAADDDYVARLERELSQRR